MEHTRDRELVAKIRDLNDEIDRYAVATSPANIARRDALLQVLEWYVQKLQARRYQGRRDAA